jgi:hypothetical protein
MKERKHSHSHIQQSGILFFPCRLFCCALPAPLTGDEPGMAGNEDRASDLRFLIAAVLRKDQPTEQYKIRGGIRKYSLERISRLLPLPPNLDPNLHTLIYILRTPLIIHAQLHHIPIFQPKRLTLHPRRAQPRMVQKRTRTALRVLDIKLAARQPNLRVGSGHHFGLERELVGAEGVDGGEPQAGAVGEAPDAEGRVGFFDVAGDGVEFERASAVEVRDEADAEGGGRVGGRAWAR